MIKVPENKDYWFYLEPFVHVSKKKNKILIYNTLNGKALEYIGEPEIEGIINNLLSKKNLLVIKLTGKYIKANPIISKFLNRIINNHMGDLLDASLSYVKPIQFKPMLNVQRDVKRLKKESTHSVGKDIMNYFDELSLYLNSNSGIDKPVFYDGFKQFLFCINKKNKDEELKFDDISELLNEAGGSTLSLINILGGNIFKYSRFNDLVSLLNINYRKLKKVFHIHYSQFEGQANKIKLFSLNTFSQFKVLVDSPIDKDKLEKNLKRINKIKAISTFEFVVANEEDYQHAEEFIIKHKIEHSFQPYFTGSNLSFFKKYVFLKKKMVFESKPTIEEILTRMAVNPVNFGKITVLPDGNVYANINASKVGKLGRDSLYKMIYNEINKGMSWRRLRRTAHPCKHCAFELICPPLSNYEYAIGKNNLCNIWK